MKESSRFKSLELFSKVESEIFPASMGLSPHSLFGRALLGICTWTKHMQLSINNPNLRQSSIYNNSTTF